MPRTPPSMIAAALVASVLAAAGCSGGGGSGALPSASAGHASPSPSASATTWSSTQQQVIAAYLGFWRALPNASRADSANNRLALLVPVATDPELSQLIAGLGRQHASGRRLYGTNVPRPLNVEVSGPRAVLRDCQDSHRAGIQDIKTGNRLTVGVARHLVTSVLVLRDSAWKVSTVQYAPSGTTC